MRGHRPLLLLALAAGLVAGEARAADPATCRTVRLADLGWTDIAATNALAGVALRGLGYETELVGLALPDTFAGMKAGSVDAFLGNWMPSMGADIAPYAAEGSVETVAQNLAGAGYGLVVPDYVAAAGVKSLADLGASRDRFGGSIQGIEPGNDGNRIIADMIADPSAGLAGFTLAESSEAEMVKAAEEAIAAKQWIVFLGWAPHPVMSGMALTYLAGTEKYGFGPATVHTNVRKGYRDACPNAGRLMAQLRFTLPMESAVMADILDAKAPDVAAAHWLKANPDALGPWLDGVTTLSGEPGLAAVRSSLGL